MAYKEIGLWKITGDAFSQTKGGLIEFSVLVAEEDLILAIDVFIGFLLPATIERIRRTEYLGQVIIKD